MKKFHTSRNLEVCHRLGMLWGTSGDTTIVQFKVSANDDKAVKAPFVVSFERDISWVERKLSLTPWDTDGKWKNSTLFSPMDTFTAPRLIAADNLSSPPTRCSAISRMTPHRTETCRKHVHTCNGPHETKPDDTMNTPMDTHTMRSDGLPLCCPCIFLRNGSASPGSTKSFLE